MYVYKLLNFIIMRKKSTIGILLIILLFVSINVKAQIEQYDEAGNSLKQGAAIENVVGDEIIITETADGAICVYAADIDGDGDQDVVSASQTDGELIWYENLDGLGDFHDGRIISNSLTDLYSIFVIDIDGDDDLDIFIGGGSGYQVLWFENINGLGTFSTANTISTAIYCTSVFGADLDGDDDIDLIASDVVGDQVVWYENTDGAGTFSTENVVATGVDGAYCVYVSDIDDDLDNDIVSSSWADNKVVWFENTDGAGSFGTENIISTSASSVGQVYVCDLNNDTYPDVIYANRGSDQVVWQENNGTGTFGLENILTNTVEQATVVGPFDADNDGDIDILFGSQDDDKIGWFENTDGLGLFGPEEIISTSSDRVRSVFVADFDNNGTDDVLAASSNDNKVVWFFNQAPAPTEQALNIVVSDILENSAVINWDDGNGDKRVVFIIEDNTGEVLPVDNTSYIANTEFGTGDEIDGWFCVFNEDTHSDLLITGLTPETEYRVMVCEYTGNTESELYLTITNTDNPVNFTTAEHVNINQNVADNITIYPNPTANIINIKLNNNIDNTVKIIDISGKEILSYDNIRNNMSINLSNFSKGIYIVEITNKNEIKNIKLVIE